jgi:hypothetical protein
MLIASNKRLDKCSNPSYRPRAKLMQGCLNLKRLYTCMGLMAGALPCFCKSRSLKGAVPYWVCMVHIQTTL